jgi:hypothetical protein
MKKKQQNLDRDCISALEKHFDTFFVVNVVVVIINMLTSTNNPKPFALGLFAQVWPHGQRVPLPVNSGIQTE